jgi:hypothetical protein
VTRDAESDPAVMNVLLIGADSLDAFKPYVLQLFIEETDFVPGTHNLHGFATNALLFEVDESLPGDVRSLATGASGTITISSVGGGVSGENLDLSLDLTMEYLPEVTE